MSRKWLSRKLWESMEMEEMDDWFKEYLQLKTRQELDEMLLIINTVKEKGVFIE